MAAPTPPTLALITAEGLQKAGYATTSTQYTTLLTRAQNSWMEEIKHDIWSISKKLKSLQSVFTRQVVYGKGRYAMPGDFSSLISISLCEGEHTGACQAGSTTSTVVLAADEDVDSTWVIGKEIIILTGTGINQVSRVTGYNSSTQTANIQPSFTTAPDASDTYLIVGEENMLEEMPIWEADNFETLPAVGTPAFYYPYGDNDFGEFMIKPIPDNLTNRAVKIRYYIDLLTLDLAGTLMATLYKRWRNVFIQGVYARALQNQDDTRYMQEMSVYDRLLKQLQARETYTMDMSDLTATVEY